MKVNSKGKLSCGVFLSLNVILGNDQFVWHQLYSKRCSSYLDESGSS